MNLSLKIARRYLFARKTTNAVNIISAISVFGLALGAAALVLVLSVFNGFEVLLSGMVSNFNPDLKITASKGKTFPIDSLQYAQLRRIKGIKGISQTLEEVAFLEYEGTQTFATLKGVDKDFTLISRMDSSIREGKYELGNESFFAAVLGGGLRNTLGVDVTNPIIPLTIYMPKREEVGVLEQPFRKRLAYPVGTFVIQQDFDNQYVIVSIGLMRELLAAENEEVSAIEIKLANYFDLAGRKSIIQSVEKILGKEKYVIKDRYQQDEAFLKIMNIEKWLSYSILSLTILLVAFNMVGSLWMIVLEKRPDIAILRSMGASDHLIRNIFLFEGLLLCGVGLLLGFVLALVLYYVHRHVGEGIVPLPAGFVIDRYPIVLRWGDFLVVMATVCSIGLLAALPAALRATKVEGRSYE